MKNKLIIGAFLLILAAFVTMLALPADRASIEKENREMNEMPQLSRENVFSGKFASDFEAYTGDNIGLRSYFTAMSKSMDSAKGIIPETGSVISSNKDIGTGTTIKMTLLFVEDTVMEMFLKKEETEKMYIDAVNMFAEKLPESVKIYSMLIPTQLEFREPIYKNLQDSQADAISEMYGNLDERVTAVDVCETLGEHSDEYIYFRSDHHWTQLGAYYAYRAFANAADVAAVKNTDYEKYQIRGMLGYLYDRVNTPDVTKNPDIVEWYDLDEKQAINVTSLKYNADGTFTESEGSMYHDDKRGYSFFFGSDYPVLQLENTEKTDGKTIVVIKDSYANAFAPWLSKSYKNVILVDPRIYEGGIEAILEKFDPDELLIMNYIFTTNFPDYCGMLKNLCE